MATIVTSIMSSPKSPVTRPAEVLMTMTMLVLALLTREMASVTVSGIWSPSSSGLKVVARFGFVKSDVHNRDRTDGYIFGNITSNPELLPTVTHLNGTTKKHQQQQQQPTYVNSSDSNWRKVQSSSKATVLLVERTTLNRILGADIEPQRINLVKSGQFTGKINCSVIFSNINVLMMASNDTCPIGKNVSSTNSPSRVANSGNFNSNSNGNDYIRYLPCTIGGTCPGGSSVQQRANSQITRSQLTYVIKDQKQPT